jgi:hypothetical protein
MHWSVFAAGGPLPTPLTSIVGGSSIAVEIEARLADGSVRRDAFADSVFICGVAEGLSSSPTRASRHLLIVDDDTG